MNGRRTYSAICVLALTLWAGGRFGTGIAWAEPEPPPPGDAPKDPPPADPPKDPPPADPPPGETPPDPDAEAAAAAAAAEEKAAEAAKLEEKRLRTVVAEFNSKMKTANVDLQQRLLTDLCATKHQFIADALVPWIQPTIDERVRDLALECAKSQRFPSMARAASNLLDKNLGEIKYARALIAIMGRSKDKAQVTKLRAIMKGDNKAYTIELQKEAVVALGMIGHRDVIPDFIRMTREFENKFIPPKDVPRKEALQKLVTENLELITGRSMPNAKGWDLWWKENEKTFQKEPPKDEGAPK